MATASSSLHQPIFPQYPSLSRSSRFHPPLRFSSLRFPSRIRASSAVALEPESSTQLNNGLEFDLFSCPVCYEPLIRKGPPGLNLPAIYRSGFKCRSCNKSYSSKDMYLDLTITAGSKDYNELQPNRTELFRSPLVSFLYERGWRQNFNRSGFPGRDEEFKMAQEYFKPVIGGLLVDVSCGSGLFSRKFAESGTYSGVVALDFSENMLRQCYDFIKKENPALATTNLALVRADVSRLPFSTGSVDAVHAGAALHCWPSPSNAVAEITRILRSGGIFVGTTFLRPSFGNSTITSILRPFRQWERSLQNYNNLTEKEIEDLCTSCGLINYRSKESSPQLNNDMDFDLFSCPVCYEPLIRKGPPGLNLPAIYRSGFKCKTCNKSYSSKDMYLDLTITAGSKAYNEAQPVRTELFRSPLVSFLYERGWRQNFNLRGFPGPDEEFKMAQEYFKPAAGGLLVDVSCGSGLFSRKFAESGTYSGVVALDFSENMLRQCYDFIKKDNPSLTTNLALVRADISRLPFSSGSVDAVHAGAALHCWPSPSNAVAEITRILRSGGIFVGTTFLRPTYTNSSIPAILRPFRQSILQTSNYLTEKEIEDLCRSCALINYTSTIQQSFIMFSAQKA